MEVIMWIDEWLDENCMTGVKFAKLLGIHPSYLSCLITGKRSPGPHLAMKIDKLTAGKVRMLDVMMRFKVKNDTSRKVREEKFRKEIGL